MMCRPNSVLQTAPLSPKLNSSQQAKIKYHANIKYHMCLVFFGMLFQLPYLVCGKVSTQTPLEQWQINVM